MIAKVQKPALDEQTKIKVFSALLRSLIVISMAKTSVQPKSQTQIKPKR